MLLEENHKPIDIEELRKNSEGVLAHTSGAIKSDLKKSKTYHYQAEKMQQDDSSSEWDEINV